MSARYDLYQPGTSWLHRLDPRTKLLFAVCSSALWLQMGNLWVMLGALLLTHLALWSAHIRRERLVWVWKMTLPTMVMIALLWVVLYPGRARAWLQVGFVQLGPDNLAQGLALALRIGALAFSLFVWLFTTDQAALVRGLVALGLPYDWGLTLAMALRYLPTMASIYRMIADAQQARALELGRGNLFRRARAYLPIIVAMLITALRTAENLARALESRALGAGQRRTYLHPLRLRRADLLLMGALVAFTMALLWARYAWGVGAEPLSLRG